MQGIRECGCGPSFTKVSHINSTLTHFHMCILYTYSKDFPKDSKDFALQDMFL